MAKIPLQKFIADTGYCSRRKAEELIKSGEKRILVNGVPAQAGMAVDSGDDVKINGVKIKQCSEHIYIKVNKPRDYTCTTREFRKEKNVLSLLKGSKEGDKILSKYRLFIAGRLDKNSRGLVILTNDGDLTNNIMHPSFGCKKRYKVRIKEDQYNLREIETKFLQGMKIEDEDDLVRAEEIKHLGNKKFEIVLVQGRKRQIRKMFEAIELKVSDLVRIDIGGVNLGDMKQGEWKHLTNHEKQKLNQ